MILSKRSTMGLITLAILLALIVPPQTVLAGGVVTDCANDTQFSSLLASGGTVSFNCNGTGAVATIILNSTKTIAASVTIDGGGKITLSGNNLRRHFQVNGGDTLTLLNITLSNGKATDGGGAVRNDGNLVIQNSTLSNNTTTGNYGGAVKSDGSITITNSVFSNNTAPDGYGGAIDIALSTSSVNVTNSTFDNNSANLGGGALASNGIITITGSTFKNNVTSSSGGTSGGGAIETTGSLNVSKSTFNNNTAGKGGAIYNEGGTATITNSTFSANSVNVSPRTGGAIHNQSNGTALVIASTFSGNTATSGSGGALYNTAGDSLTVRQSILAGGSPNNCSGIIAVQGKNLESGTDCNFTASGNLQNTNPQLGALANNGGLTQTLALSAGSPAIDAGNDATCESTDQRGITRPQGSHCDIGAYEYNGNIATHTPTATATSTFTVTPTKTSTPTATLLPPNAPVVLDPSKIVFQEVVSGLSDPVFITHAGDGSGRLFIIERSGQIRILKNGALLVTPFLNISSSVKSTSGEQGLLGLAFHPFYKTNGKFYVAYTASRPNDSSGSILTLRQYSVSTGNSDLADSNSGVTILTIDHPIETNHNGGTIVFGNDGYLYWSTGDGGGGGDPNNNGQTLTNLLGKVLRIDVNSGSPYSSPATNPFYSSSVPGIKKEIWAYGLRNPWRMSFDRLTHDLYIGDVGQSAREEVDFQLKSSVGGENYGWKIMEGSICYNATTCDQNNKVLPVAEYAHTLGCSITGGYVYRGSKSPSLYGYYFYGDYCSGRFFSLYKDPSLGWKSIQLLDTPYSISTFGEDEQGELYLADYATGKLYNVSYQEFFIITGNAGIASATLSYMDGTPKTAVADGSGNYTITVPSGWSGVVTPYKTGYTFTPVNKSYSNVQSNQTAQNYTAQACVGCADINVLIGGNQTGQYTLPAQGSTRQSFATINNGPVQIASTNAVPLIGAERVIYAVNGVNTSFSEMMGLPNSQLSTTYWLPFYNNVDLDTQLRFGNVSGATATVRVYIGGNEQTGCTSTPSKPYPYILAASESVRVSCVGVSNGPVRVVSNQNIVVAERVIYKVNGVNTSFSEMMALPDSQLSTTYWLPFYNNVDLDTQLRFGNVSGATATVRVYIGGNEQTGCTSTPSKAYPYVLLTGESVRVSCVGVSNGPVRVVSDQNIVVAERVIYAVNGVNTSFAEMMGLPNSQLSTTYWLPFYNNVDLDTQLRFGNVSGATATVRVYIGGIEQTGCTSTPSKAYPYVLLTGESVRVSCVGVSSGPVRVVSDQNIVAAERVIYKVNGVNTSFSEMMALPNSLLNTTYWLPWYNNVDLDTQLRFGVP